MVGLFAFRDYLETISRSVSESFSVGSWRITGKNPGIQRGVVCDAFLYTEKVNRVQMRKRDIPRVSTKPLKELVGDVGIEPTTPPV